MKKLSKTERVRTMLNEGDISPAEIAKRVKVSKSYVYTVRSKMLAAERKPVVEAPMLVGLPDPLDIQIGGDHYKGMKIQPVQFIVANELGFLEGCIIKRICRWRVKGGIDDLEKIKHEVDLLMNLS